MLKHPDNLRTLFPARLANVEIENALSAFRTISLFTTFCGFLLLIVFQKTLASDQSCKSSEACFANDRTVMNSANASDHTINSQHRIGPNLRQLIEYERCSELPVLISGASSEERQLACAAAWQSIKYLSVCRLYPLEEVRIRIEPNPQHPEKGRIFGMYDTDADIVVIIPLTRARSVTIGTPYEVIPDREFYRSLVVHEVTHAILHRHYRIEAQSQSAHEYPAYALQYKSLSDDTRASLLSNIGIGAASGPIFNDFLLAMNPFAFGAMAYQHYTQAADACAALHQLLRNEAKFVWVTPLL